MKHGTPGGYANHKCRCTPCREAATAAARGMKARRAAGAGQRAIPHGTMNGYANYACRCDLCRVAQSRYRAGLAAAGTVVGGRV